MSVYVIRAFIELREKIAANAAILKRLAEIDKTRLEHDTALRDIYQKLLPLFAPAPEHPRRQIGFHVISVPQYIEICGRKLRSVHAQKSN